MLGYFTISLVPSVLWLWWIRRQDIYEAEPVGLVLRTFAGGMAMAVPAVFIEHVLRLLLVGLEGGGQPFDEGGRLGQALIYCFAIVAPVEEYLKYRTVRRGAYLSPEFNEPMDGIVYMTSAALGFSTVENALYMLGFGPWVLALRMVMSSFLHLACSGILGFYLGLARFRPREEGRLLKQGFMAAIGLHGAYDFLVFYQPLAGLCSFAALLGALYWMRQRLFDKIDQALQESPFRPRRTLLALRSRASEVRTADS